MNDELEELMARIARLPTEELRRMVEVDFEQYRPEALAYARAELRDRGIAPGASPERSPDPRQAPSESQPGLACLRCNAGMRYIGTKRLQDDARWGVSGHLGTLYKDEDYENLDAYLCPQCGRLELFINGIGDALRPK